MSQQANNYMKLAVNAFDVGNYEEAYIYSTKALEFDPDNWQATIIKGISVAGSAKIANPRFGEMIAIIRRVLYNIPDAAMPVVAGKFADFSVSYYSHVVKRKYYDVDGKVMFLGRIMQVIHLMGLAFLIHPTKEYATCVTTIYKTIFNPDNHETISDLLTEKYRNQTIRQMAQMDYILSVAEKYLVAEDPNYESISIDHQLVLMNELMAKYDEENEKRENAKKKGCFIATAVYGNYNSPEVVVLRRFRDNVLDKCTLGRIFIQIYYTISPSLADWLHYHSSIKVFVRKLLDRLVDVLNKQK